jgi:protein-tyrosine phosphatase
MIDTHCHLLPDIDDGPSSQVDSVRMARRLAENGVRLVVCTPHHSTVYPTDVTIAAAKLERLRLQLATLEIPLELRLAAELSAERLLALDPSEIKARTLGPRHLLFELPRETSTALIDDAVDRLETVGLFPVLAHPERCLVVQRDLAFVDRLRERGGLVQIVVPSLAGSSGSPVSETAWSLLDSGRADLVASDAHRPYGVRVRLAAIAELLTGRYGREATEELLERCPARIVGETATTPAPEATNGRFARP